MRISACYIVKNEAARLSRSLASLSGAVDEIVVVDSGSTDDTVRIAEEFGAQVFQSPWRDDFSAARNVSLSKATGDWILVGKYPAGYRTIRKGSGSADVPASGTGRGRGKGAAGFLCAEDFTPRRWAGV